MMLSYKKRASSSAARFVVLLPLLSSLACGDLVSVAELPAGTQAPDTYNTPDGALKMYRGTKGHLRNALLGFVRVSGLLADELSFARLGSGPGSIGAQGDLIDARILEESRNGNFELKAYAFLQTLRGSTRQTNGILRTYAPDLSPALQAEMYTLEGYAETMLAELYCSGVPLSTFDFQGDFTYQPGSTTTEVLRHALVLFDSALTISSDSASTTWLASVGKARALLALERYAEAAQAVAMVPDTFQYRVPVTWQSTEYPFAVATPDVRGLNVATREGGNGMPFYTRSGPLITSNDPRAAVIPTSPATNVFGVLLVTPAKYPVNSAGALVLASGVEARLVEAEVALRAGDPRWLTILNTLRTNGVVSFPYRRLCQNGISGTGAQPGSPCPLSPVAPNIDTTWGSGTGIELIPAAVRSDNGPVCPTSPAPGTPCTDTVWYRGLRPLGDPGASLSGQAAADARLDLVFRERAYWLFLTGHRQGDLRRLVRNDHKPQSTVYPTGAYFGGFGFYGAAVNMPIPAEERVNPRFQGCLDREA